jgi:hypothetical protein
MIRTLALIAVLCAPLPAVAQTAKVYTNADLGQKTVTWQHSVTPDEWAGIVARQFIPPPQVSPWGPSVYVSPWTSDAIPATPSMFGGSSYADSLWSDPVSAYALQHPIEAAYGYRHSYGASFNRSPRAFVRPRGTPSVTAAPRTTVPSAPIITHGATAGHRVR